MPGMEYGMSIRRGPSPASNYAQIHNDALRDRRLSWKARGLLAYLLSHAEGWETSVARLQAAGTDGRDSVRSGLAELRELGYLTRSDRRQHDENGRLKGYVYTVTDAPASDFPTQVLPTLENPTHLRRPSVKKTNTEEDQYNNGRAGRATQSQVDFIRDMWVQSGRLVTPEVEEEWSGMSISQADAAIRAAKGERREWAGMF